MGWDDAEKTAESHSSGGKFVRLKNHKDKVIGIFVGEPEAAEVLWDGAKYHPADSDAGKKLAAEKKKATAKFKFNFYVPAEDLMKVYECGVVTFKDILKAKAKYGLDKKMFEIERNGVAKDPKTTYTVLPDADITDEVRAKLAKHPLHDLKNVEDDETEGAPATGAGFSNYNGANGAANGEALVDDKTKEKLMAILKPLERSLIEKFLARFGIAKVKELKAKDGEAAFAFIDEITGKKEAEKPAAAQNDPFAD